MEVAGVSKNRKYALLIAAGAILFAWFIFGWDGLPRQEEEHIRQISYLYRSNSVDETQQAAKQGIDQAAKDYKCEITATAFDPAITAKEQKRLIEKEVENGAEAILIEPLDDKKVAQEQMCIRDRENIALLTEERRATGIFGILSVLDNTVIVNQKAYAHGGVLRDGDRLKAAEESNAELRTKTPNMDENMENLSGGNQQKVLLARWLLTDPDILILDEPTRGIDVGAKYEIYMIMHKLVEQGKSIIMISSEMPELLGMSDRIMAVSYTHLDVYKRQS